MSAKNAPRFPEAIAERPIWVTWAFDDVGRKRPRAPWLGHSYPTRWGQDAEERPEVEFETAAKWASLRKWELDVIAPFPDDCPDPDLKLGILLPHEPSLEFPLMLVDLDDVRDPETGEITEPARRIIERLDAFGEVSISGRGIHLFVRASLPPAMGKFIEPLDPEDPSLGQIELYDHGRFAALTGEHVEGTPFEVPERQEEIEAIIEEFHNGDDDPFREPEFDPGDYDPPELEDGDRGRSPYFEEAILGFTGPLYGEKTPRGARGAHPAHGATDPGHDDKDSRNFNIDSGKNVWHCFAHGSGGGPLSLVAVLEDILGCGDCGDARQSALDQLSDEEFLETCLAARDKYGFSGEPPYRALVAVAQRHDLPFANVREGILGRDAYRIARRIYENTA